MILTPEILKKYRTKKGLSQQEVADFIGTSQKSYQYYETGERKPKQDKVLKLIEILEIKSGTNVLIHTIPYYDVSASAGLLVGITDGKMQPDEHISVPGLNDCDLALNVWGDSMFPEYCSGEIIACKSIPLDKELSYVRFGEAYVAFCDDGIVLKFIKKGKDSSHLTFESKNEHYEPYQVHKARIKNLYLVKGVITRKNL
jgi:transcriptional regulator with XRE-family HTH domain